MHRWHAGVLCVLVACAEEERAPFFDATLYRNEPQREALERGLSAGDFVRCDIREDACQDMLFRATADAYGSDGTRPPVTIVSPDGFLDEVSRRSEALAGASALAEQERLYEEMMRMFVLLGLVSPTLSVSDTEDVGTILAAYFWAQKDVLVIDHGMDMDSPLATLTLSHEFTHALQDAEYDLASVQATVASTDEQEGHLGLIEGEAELYAGLVTTGEVIDDLQYWRAQRRGLLQGSVESLAPFFAADLSFPYLIGNEYATFVWLDGGNQALADRWGDVPSSSREILAGATAQVPAGGWVERPTGTADAQVAQGFEPILADGLGAWVFHVFLEALAFEADAGTVRLPDQSVATDLRGDELVFFGRDEDRVAAWRLRFEPSVTPSTVIAEIEDVAPGRFRLREEAGDLLLFAGEPSAALDEFAQAFAPPTTGGAAARVQVPGLPRRSAAAQLHP